MNFKTKKPTLLLVDVQKAFLDKDYPGIKRNNPEAEFVCGKILGIWRKKKFPIIHVRHSSDSVESKLHESNTGFEFNDYVTPKGDEIVLKKNVNSAFIGTDLKSILYKSNTEILIIVGMTTNHCISTTVRMSGNLGFKTYLISDSTACYNTKGINGEIIDCEVIYQAALASLNEEFASVINSEELINLIE